jgi:hypothetical protein
VYGNAIHPPGTSPWGVRLQIAFLFPESLKEMQLEKKLNQLQQEQPQEK